MRTVDERDPRDRDDRAQPDEELEALDVGQFQLRERGVVLGIAPVEALRKLEAGRVPFRRSKSRVCATRATTRDGARWTTRLCRSFRTRGSSTRMP
jgi:hypothetical protein